jgi:RNA polymerase sigma factor (sigma-70 family)
MWFSSPVATDFENKFETLYPQIFKYYRFRGADPDTANDLTSLVFERALRGLAFFNPQKASFKTWLYTIARNTAINYWKSGQRKENIDLDAAVFIPTGQPTPEQSAIAHENRDELLAALKTLDECEQEIIALKFAFHLPNKEIAKMMGLSTGNAGIILHRSMKKLRTQLSDFMMEACDA